MATMQDLRSYGWSPGAYQIICVYCRKQAEADKRAFSCEDCARFRADEETRQSCADMADLINHARQGEFRETDE